jgi:hypothetical protein
MSPRPFQDEAGDLNNTHNITHNHKTVEKINITLDASTGSSPPQSPRQEVNNDWRLSPSPSSTPQQSPQQRVTEEYVIYFITIIIFHFDILLL